MIYIISISAFFAAVLLYVPRIKLSEEDIDRVGNVIFISCWIVFGFLVGISVEKGVDIYNMFLSWQGVLGGLATIIAGFFAYRGAMTPYREQKERMAISMRSSLPHVLDDTLKQLREELIVLSRVYNYEVDKYLFFDSSRLGDGLVDRLEKCVMYMPAGPQKLTIDILQNLQTAKARIEYFYEKNNKVLRREIDMADLFGLFYDLLKLYALVCRLFAFARFREFDSSLITRDDISAAFAEAQHTMSMDGGFPPFKEIIASRETW